MVTMATIEEKHTLTGVDRRKYFREQLLERIREQTGTDNADQPIREEILLDVCAKISAVYVGCLNIVEESLGEDVWAYHMEPEKFQAMSKEQQERCKFLSMIDYKAEHAFVVIHHCTLVSRVCPKRLPHPVPVAGRTVRTHT